MLRSLFIYLRTSSGILGWNLICSSDISTLYSNFILAIAFFESLIMRVSFRKFSTSASSSQTCMSITALQVSTMTLSSCSHCFLASSLSLENSFSSFYIDSFSDFAFSFSNDICYSRSYNSAMIPCWNSCSIWRGSAMKFIWTLRHALACSLYIAASNLTAPNGTCNILSW